MSVLEIRTAALTIEQRGTGTKRKLVGHAAVFDSPALIAGQFREQVQRGAFLESIAQDDVRALFNHDWSAVLGRTKAGTLRLSEDSRGLRTEIDVPDTQLGRDVITLVERGDISGMSFGFVVLDEDWQDENDPPLRIVKKVGLFEVSICPLPAYESTDVSVRIVAHSAAAAAARLRFCMKHKLWMRQIGA